jgi:hypothetical protein
MSSAADRKRAARARRAAGVRFVVSIPLSESVLDALVEDEELAPEEAEDREQASNRLGELLEEKFWREGRGGKWRARYRRAEAELSFCLRMAGRRFEDSSKAAASEPPFRGSRPSRGGGACSSLCLFDGATSLSLFDDASLLSLFDDASLLSRFDDVA